jgi:monovalent cation:H+ antiporter-2, CPA2 family
MMSHSALYRDLAYVFVAALLGGLVARRLRQPLIIGYVLGGIIIGPFTPGPTVSEIHVLELFAEVGVILLMYSIGIEFSVRDLLQVRWVSLVGGPLGILAVIGVALAGGRLMGWSTLQSVSIGAVVSLASTMVLTRLLMDRGELHSEQGRAMVGITLVDDLVFVVMTVLLPSLGAMSGSRLLGLGLAFGKAIAILVPVVIVAAKIIPPLMARVPRTDNQELRVLVALGLGFATAAATQALGLSLALGAFLADMIVSESNVAHETLTDLLRNSFTALFFVTIGALVDPKALLSNPKLLAMLVLLIVVGKFLIWTAVVWLFRYSLRTAILVGVGLTQIGEFSYVLVQVARDARLVEPDVYSATLAASLLTILLNAFLMRAAPGWIAGYAPTPRRTVSRTEQ